MSKLILLRLECVYIKLLNVEAYNIIAHGLALKVIYNVVSIRTML